MNYDIFNGDADGLCALIQLRLAEPREARLITGIKRDIQLLKKIDVNAGDQLTVLDISLDKNAAHVQQFLNAGAQIFYADHHQATHIPEHVNFQAHIDTSPHTCTSLIVHHYLQGQFPQWAITAAFGDNLDKIATQLADAYHLTHAQLEKLQKLGIYINYNGYGSCIEDLHFAPEQLYTELARFQSPLQFISECPAIYTQLEQGYLHDMQLAKQTPSTYQDAHIAVYILPDQAWSRRISGVLGNDLANQTPERAHAVLTYTPEGDYQVSVRAPLTNKAHADELCAAFATGGGRKSAAGINHLPQAQLDNFIQKFAQTYA